MDTGFIGDTFDATQTTYRLRRTVSPGSFGNSWSNSKLVFEDKMTFFVLLFGLPFLSLAILLPFIFRKRYKADRTFWSDRPE